MTLDLNRLMAGRRGEKYGLNERYLNAQLVRVLKTIGYDVNFVAAEGAYLTDAAGGRYLDLLSGFGVFAIGRNHPAVIAALKQALDARLPNLVQMDVSLLAGLLAERLLPLAGMERAFFCSTCAEAVVRNLDGAFARIWTLNDDKNMLELQASAGLYTRLDGAHARIPVGSYKIGMLATERKPRVPSKGS